MDGSPETGSKFRTPGVSFMSKRLHNQSMGKYVTGGGVGSLNFSIGSVVSNLNRSFYSQSGLNKSKGKTIESQAEGGIGVGLKLFPNNGINSVLNFNTQPTSSNNKNTQAKFINSAEVGTQSLSKSLLMGAGRSQSPTLVDHSSSFFKN